MNQPINTSGWVTEHLLKLREISREIDTILCKAISLVIHKAANDCDYLGKWIKHYTIVIQISFLPIDKVRFTSFKPNIKFLRTDDIKDFNSNCRKQNL